MDLSIITGITALVGTIGTLIGVAYKIGKTSNKIDVMDKEIKDIKQQISQQNDDLITMRSILSLKHKGVADIFSQKHSPISLNSYGITQFEKMNGHSFLETNKEKFFKKIDERKPNAALDVENAALDVENAALDVENAALFACISLSNETFFKSIKDFVYNSPIIKVRDKEIELSLDDACYILSIPLRDMYLQEHKELLPK